MRSLRILRVLALTGTAWALAMLCWLLPVRADASLPQAPNPQTALTIVVDTTGGDLALSGTLTSGGKPVSGADVIIALDTQSLGKVTTGGDGSYSTSTKLPSAGRHLVTAVFAGDKTSGPATATERFILTPPTTAPPPPPPTVITAQLSPNPVAAGDVLTVTGNLVSAGVPVDSARVDISCDFGGVTDLMGVTDASGNFSANLSLPATGQPSKLTVTVTYDGDDRFAPATATFQAAVTAAVPPSAVAPPTIAPPSTPAPTSDASAIPTVVSSSTAMTLRNEVTPATTFGVVLGIVGIVAVLALGVLWVLAWQRHDLMPGERRGFGSDFGRRRHSA